MHYRMLVTITLPDGGTSEEARQAVHDTLLSDDSFCGEGGRFGSPLCDWFVIGGRWSGLLAETAIGEAHKAAITARFPEMADAWWPESLSDRHGPELDAIWHEHGGTGPSRYTRDSHDDLGFPDDAMVISPRVYDALLAEYAGQGGGGDEGYIDLDGDALQPDFVGRKWIVVVDYHN